MFFLPPQNGGRVKLSLMFGTITFMLRKETKCVFFWEAKTISKMWRICLNFYPPQNMLFWGSKSSFCLPPTQKKMGVDRKHLELCNKKFTTAQKFYGAQLFGPKSPMFWFRPNFSGHPKKPTQNVKERDRWTTMGHDIHPSPKVLGGWKCRKPLPDMGH